MDQDSQPSSADPTPKIVVGGRTFVPCVAREETLGRRLYLISQIRKSGLKPIEVYQTIADPEQRAMAILADVYDSGNAFTLLAGLLVEDGKRWSKDRARDNAALFEEADGDGLNALSQTLNVTLLALFSSGSSSATTSPRSSSLSTTAAPSAPETSAPSTSGTGDPSSAPSPEATPTTTAASSSGQ